MNNRTIERGQRRLSRFLSACCVLCLAATGGVFSAAAGASALPNKSSDLFQLTNVWTIHLQFTPEQWKAMEPAENERAMPGPMRFRFGGPGGPGRAGPGGPGPGGFGPAMFLAPGFLQGDQNQDGKLSKDEFHAVGERWFSDWDKAKTGELDLNQIQSGMNSTFTGPQMGQMGQPGGRGPQGGPPGPPLEGAEGHRNGLASAAGIDFQYVHADLDFEGQRLRDIGVRYKGNGTYMESRGSIKRSFKIELNKYVKGQKLAGMTKLNLHNNVTDPSWMNEVLSYRLFRDASVPAPRTAYARVYVTVPGEYDKKYFGLYSIVEDVDRHFAEERFGSKEGMIYKPVTRDLFGYLGDDWSKYNQAYDPKGEPSGSEKRRIIDFSQLVTSASDAEFSTRIAEYLDLEEFARFMSVTVWLSTMDSILMMGQNFYVYLHPQTHKLAFIPWDLDHSFGQFPMAGTQEEREKLSIEQPWRGANRFLERVFKVDTFKKLYLATMREFSKTIFLPERFGKQVDEVAAAIRPAVREESEAKLARFDKVVAGESVDRFGFGGGGDRMIGPGGDRPRFRPGGFGQPSKPIKAFATARAESVAAQLQGKSDGAVATESSFPRFGPRGGGPGGPDGFGPGMFLGRAVMDQFDANKDGKVTHNEFKAGLAKWFEDWNSDKSGLMTEEQLRSGINRDLAPFRGGPPGGPGFGGPGDGPPDE
jgi:spore coat protein CotH